MKKVIKNHSMLKLAVVSILTILIGGSGKTDASPLTQDKLLAQANVKENNTYEEFRSFLMNAVNNPNYWASYQMEMSNHPPMIVEQWLKGERFRVDTQLQGTTARLYRMGEQVTNCLAQGTTWTCFRLPSLNQLTGPGIQGLETLEDIKNNPQNYQNQITAAGRRVIAGETTTCFKVNQLENSDSWLSCYSNNHGIPLYMEGQYKEGTWKMTATDFQTAVSDRAFSLPAQPQFLPGMPNGFPIPNR